jgi:hypothetical protein
MSNVPNVPNVQNNPIVFLARASINTAVIVGMMALVTGSTLLYSVSFTGMVVGFVAGSIYLLQKK